MDPSMLNPAMLQALMQQFMAHGGTLPPQAVAAAAATMEAAEEEEGRSRKHRDGDFELTGALAGMPQSILALPNPAVPLKFEQPPGKWRVLDVITMESSSLSTFTEDYVSPEAQAAHVAALQAYGSCTWQEAVKEAQRALSISPICPEAYNLLALAQADSYEAALDYYRKAAELGPQVVHSDRFQDVLKERNCWQKPPLRAYYRGLYGVANTLRKMGRYAESLAAYDKLLAADGTWYSFSSYVNVMALYPFVVLGAKGPRALIEFMRSYPHTEEQFTYISSSAYWTGAYTLADLMVTHAKGTSAKANGAKVTPDDGWAADGLDLQKMPSNSRGHDYLGVKSRPLFCFCHTFFEAVDYLLGDKALPPGIPTACTGGGKTQTAATLAYTTGAQWRSQPHVIERLRRYRNTYEVRALVQDMRQRLKVDLADIKHYLTAPGGFHAHALEREFGPQARVKSLMYTMCDYPNGKEFSKDEIKVLKWLIDAGVPVTDTHPNHPSDQPLHMACYQGYGPEVVKLMLAAGADPLLPNVEGLTALTMTANQGNWREMQAVLQAHPHLKTANAAAVTFSVQHMFGNVPLAKLTVPEALLISLLNTSCLPCLSGGDPCLRCNNGIPHSPHVDFFKFAEVVVAEADVRKLSKAAMDDMAGAARAAGPGSPWAKLQKVILRAVDRQKKAPAAAVRAASPAAASPAAEPAGASSTQPSERQSSTAAGSSTSSSSSIQGQRAAQQQEQQQQQQQQQQSRAQPAEARGERACWGCGVAAGPDRTLQKCSGCRKAFYCSRSCQEAAWKGHKADCKKWGAERAAAKQAKQKAQKS